MTFSQPTSSTTSRLGWSPTSWASCSCVAPGGRPSQRSSGSFFSGVRSATFSQPETFSLANNHPNPFNASTRITFRVPQSSQVELKIFNVRGQEVKSLLDKSVGAGSYTLLWDGTDSRGRAVASGIYFCHMKADAFQKSMKMLLLR